MTNDSRKSALAHLEQRLASYAAMTVAAVAGGASPAAAAVIVHDPADVTTTLNGFIAFNVATGAVSTATSSGMNFRIDFRTSTFTTPPQTHSCTGAEFDGVGPNDRVLESSQRGDPLRLGVSFLAGPGGNFGGGGYLAQHVTSYSSGVLTNSSSRGNFFPNPGGVSGFLGLEFVFNGNTHYGWAFITVNPGFSTTLHSFAWEDSPGEAIHIAPEPHTAVLLALGTAGLVALRRRRATRV